jgi:hypothetical protein
MSGLTLINYAALGKEFIFWILSALFFLTGLKFFKVVIMMLLEKLYQFFIQQNKMEL